MEFLAEVAKHHTKYISYVKKMGVRDDAEDIVQEMYIRLTKYTTAEKCITKGKVNVHYIWRILYSLANDYHRASGKIKKVDLDAVNSLSIEQEDSQMEEAYERIVNKLILSLDKLDENDTYAYNKELFVLYADSLMSMRKLAAETKISLTSIFHT